MRAINYISLFFFCLPCLVSAATSADCLNHLGGAFAGVECYNGLANDISIENRNLISRISESIPAGTKQRALLKQYERNQTAAKQFCQLGRNAANDWAVGKEIGGTRYHNYDVIYYECIYNLVSNENIFLKAILKSSTQ